MTREKRPAHQAAAVSRPLAYDLREAGEKDLRDVIAGFRYCVREDAAYDNWNGGMSGHDVVFFLPLAV